MATGNVERRMGLTHYWYRPTELPAEIFAAAVDDVRLVLKRLDLPLAGFEGKGEPILTPSSIVFNGAGEDAVEPFEIQQVEFDRRGRAEFYGYCKTAGRPYDLAVRAALIVMQHHFRDKLKVMSDESPQSWGDARRVVHETLGYGDEFQLAPKE